MSRRIVKYATPPPSGNHPPLNEIEGEKVCKDRDFLISKTIEPLMKSGYGADIYLIDCVGFAPIAKLVGRPCLGLQNITVWELKYIGGQDVNYDLSKCKMYIKWRSDSKLPDFVGKKDLNTIIQQTSTGRRTHI